MTIPFVDLQAQYKELEASIQSAINKILQDTSFIQGSDVKLFEEEFAAYIGTKYCVGLNSGTDALILGIKALELKKGEIIVPAQTYYSGALAPLVNDFNPVFVDVDENDFGINLEDLKKKINQKTRAIIVTHLYGQADKIDEIKKIINQTNKEVLIIEDACQSHGAYFKKAKVGTFGVFAAFSFYPGKNLGAFGDAGALVTNDKKIEKKLKLLREYGQEKKYYHTSIGYNSRLDTLQAAILRVKLPYLDQWNKKRQKIAAYYTKQLNAKLPFIKTPNNFDERKSVYHVYVVRVPKRDALLAYLRDNNVFAQIHYPVPLHLQESFNFLGYKRGDLPLIEKISSEIISLPIYPHMIDENVDFVIKKIIAFYKK